ncbi:hypothetical protein [Limimaricola pyoseonensis]|uniref:hypothetical protein n=1 Tax=Limimaricola pyoseonensis TaxID=521013 RepID=UPI000B7FFCB1|nr:hypothetical protein [Limimaricola pyoseonensis]
MRSFAEIHAAPEIYRAYVGRFAFDEGKLPHSDAPADVSAVPNPIPAEFAGHQLGTTGFETPVETPMVLQPSCLGPWCGGLAPGDEVLVFARVEDGRLIVDLEPCPGKVQAAPDAAAREALAACMRGEDCRPAE